MSKQFIAVGENIHCTRIFKVGGARVKTVGNGNFITFSNEGSEDLLPIPERFTSHADWDAGKVKHCAVAFWQALHGKAEDRAKGEAYLTALAQQQYKSGATYLDINVDEYSTDVEERVELMKWAVNNAQQAVPIPVSVDSSNLDIIRAGVSAADRSRSKPMINSVSLERRNAVSVAAEGGAVVIASAAGENGLPSSMQERMANIDSIVEILHKEGLKNADIHVDPLVFPISTDGSNGPNFLQTVAQVRKKYGPDIHIVAGLSNVSFGMPNRKLINQVFAWLAVDAGADGGIVDPLQINGEIISRLNPEGEEFKLARDLLTGTDEFGLNFIEAFRNT